MDFDGGGSESDGENYVNKVRVSYIESVCHKGAKLVNMWRKKSRATHQDFPSDAAAPIKFKFI